DFVSAGAVGIGIFVAVEPAGAFWLGGAGTGGGVGDPVAFGVIAEIGERAGARVIPSGGGWGFGCVGCAGRSGCSGSGGGSGESLAGGAGSGACGGEASGEVDAGEFLWRLVSAVPGG